MANAVKRQGFTLVEAVISAAILVIVIAGSYSVLTLSSKMIRSSRDHYIAINISRARMERVRNFRYNQLSTLAETNALIDDKGNPDTSGYYRRSTLIQTNYAPGLTKVEVRTDIRDLRTLTFSGENESVACLFTEYLTQ